MNLDLPPHLESTRDLLAGSLQLHATEHAPAVPADLLNDLDRRFNAAPVAAATCQPRSWFEVVQSFISRPAFGMAALAIAILGIFVPPMIETFRGTPYPPTESHNIRIVLIQPPAGFQQALAGVIESGIISSAASSESFAGPRVLVDFEASTITAVNAADEKVHTVPLPKDAEEISVAVATAVIHLR